MLLRYTVVSTCSYRHYRSIGQSNKQTYKNNNLFVFLHSQYLLLAGASSRRWPSFPYNSSGRLGELFVSVQLQLWKAFSSLPLTMF